MLSNFRRWLAPPVFEGDEDKSRAGTLLNIILWVFIIGSLLYGLFAPIEPEVRFRRVIIIVPFVLALLFLKQMVNWGYVRSTGMMIVFALWAVITVAMFYGADYNNPAFMGYLVVVICAGLILNWRVAIGWSSLQHFYQRSISYTWTKRRIAPIRANVTHCFLGSANHLYSYIHNFDQSVTAQN